MAVSSKLNFGGHMDTKRRLTVKAITWQLLGLAGMLLIGLIFTGSIASSGGIAISGSLVGFISYFGHELFWSRISWGRISDQR